MKPRKGSQKQTLDLSPARATLLNAAKRLFARRGLSGTSIRDIAQEAGLNSALISYYFDGKVGLYKACLEDIGEARLSMIEKILPLPQSREEFTVRLRLLIENLFELYLQDRDAGLILVREYDRVQSPAEQTFKDTFLKIFDRIVAFFTEAQKHDWIRKKQDPFILTSLLLGVISNEMRFDHIREKIYHRTLRNDLERKRIEDHIVQLFQPKCDV